MVHYFSRSYFLGRKQQGHLFWLRMSGEKKKSEVVKEGRRNGRGMTANLTFYFPLTRAQNELGSPTTADCSKDESVYAPHVCRWTLPRRDRGMFAFLRYSGDELLSATIYYVKREEALEMRERAIKAGKIDG